MISQYVMRPSKCSDLDALMQLAEQSGAGFTSLPEEEEILAERIRKSDLAFRRCSHQHQYQNYLMMMEHLPSGQVVGCSAVKVGSGIEQPFHSYRIVTNMQSSHAVGPVHFGMDVLVLTNEYIGYTEVCTLFVRSEHRGAGVGRLAAQSRYLLMAAAPERFTDNVLAELRGVVDESGVSPFWESLGRHFFRMDFDHADRLSATTNNQFIADLMPRFPIYIDLLPSSAREVIGRCHKDGTGALKLLQWEGFRCDRSVDIFDAGPLVTARKEDIRTIRESRTAKVAAGQIQGDPRIAVGLVSNDRLQDFRSMAADMLCTKEGTLVLEPEILAALRLSEGATARFWIEAER